MRKTTCIKKYYSASITVEASIILSVVLLSLAAFIRYAYTVHDAVTGSMILEETLERARNNVNEKKTIDSFEQEGSQMGNPRLYLGAYELHLNLGALSAEGDAAAAGACPIGSFQAVVAVGIPPLRYWVSNHGP